MKRLLNVLVQIALILLVLLIFYIVEGFLLPTIEHESTSGTFTYCNYRFLISRGNIWLVPTFIFNSFITLLILWKILKSSRNTQRIIWFFIFFINQLFIIFIVLEVFGRIPVVLERCIP